MYHVKQLIEKPTISLKREKFELSTVFLLILRDFQKQTVFISTLPGFRFVENLLSYNIIKSWIENKWQL